MLFIGRRSQTPPAVNSCEGVPSLYCPACETTTSRAATRSVTLLAAPALLWTVTVAGPDPGRPPVTVAHETGEGIDAHPQADVVVTLTVAVPPAFEKLSEAGETV